MTTNEKEPQNTRTLDEVTAPQTTEAVPVRTTDPAHKSKLSGSMIGLAIGAAVLLLLGGVGIGFAVSKISNHTIRSANRFGTMQSPNSTDMPSGIGRRGGMRMGEYGKVTSVSSDSITISDSRSGGSTTFSVTSDTSVKDKDGNDAKIGDVKTGDTVSITGTAATDDTAAGTIIINPTVPSDRF